ncbi:Inhibitor of nuclear factor kappa-B kinase subunit alpha, partial [Stegodyphus mimosarum]
MVESWKNSFENLKNIELLKQKISLLEESSARISSCTIDLQRSVYVRSKYNSPLEDTHQKILDAFADLRRRSKEQRQVPHDNTDIVRLLCLCLQQRHAQIQDIMFHIRKVNQVKRETEDILPQIMNLNKEIMEWDSQVDVWQSRRQEELWKVIDALNDRIRVMGRSSSPLLSSSPQSVTLQRPVFSRFSPDSSLRHLSESSGSQMSLRNSSPIISPPARQSRLEALSVSTFHGENDAFEKMKYSPSLSSFSSAMSLATLLAKTSEDSRRIKKENETLIESFQNMTELFKSCQETDATIVASSEKILDSDVKKSSS